MRASPGDGVAQASFLIIRRDNIGDLVCTTALLHALRERFNNAHIAVLVNSYNAAVLDRNPDVDAVHIYTKAKHRGTGQSIIGVYWDRLRLLLNLRRMRFDYAILAGSGYQAYALRTAKLARPRHIIGFVHDRNYTGAIDMPVWKDPEEFVHEVEVVQRLLAPLGIRHPPSRLRVYPDPIEVAKVRDELRNGGVAPGNTVGLHISARTLDRRWPSDKFVALVRRLHDRHGCNFLLFWSPGTEENPLHPGDDAMAKAIIEACGDYPIHGYHTDRLDQLIAGLSVCDTVICSDGGAVHLAAALGKKIVCFFGRERPERWYPWQTPHVLVRAASRQVSDISVEEVIAAYKTLSSATDSIRP
jgi:heptosyltransferase-3